MDNTLTSIYSQEISTPIGSVFAVADINSLYLLAFTEQKNIPSQLAQISNSLGANILPGENPILALLKTQLNQYFSGNLQQFSIPLQLCGTEFQRSVWQTLQQIPYGKTICYQQQAQAINQPTAVRAVANANACNKLPIIIPCHRVIGKNGSLTGYAGELWRKQFLLDLEQETKF